MSCISVCGSDIKILDKRNDFSVVNSYDVRNVNRDGDLKCTNWCKDGSWLLCSLSKGPFPLLRFKNNNLQPGKIVDIPTATASCLFNRTNKFIAVGEEDGSVLIWDVKTNKCHSKVNCAMKNGVKFITVNKEDTHIASVKHYSGDINIYSIVSNNVVSSLRVPRAEAVTNLLFSDNRKFVLGASSDNMIMIWDILKLKLIFKQFSPHSGAISGFSFSAMNESLFSSVSFDKTINIYDIRQDSLLKKIIAPKSLTCVDVILDGKQIAAGSSSGNLFIYDLRNLTEYLHDIKCDSGPLQHVKSQCFFIPDAYENLQLGCTTVENPIPKPDAQEMSLVDILSPLQQTPSASLSMPDAPKKQRILFASDKNPKPSSDTKEGSVYASPTITDDGTYSFLNPESLLEVKPEPISFKTEDISPILIKRISDRSNKTDLRCAVLEKSLLRNSIKLEENPSLNNQITSTPSINTNSDVVQPNISPINNEYGDGVHVVNSAFHLSATEIKEQIESLRSEMHDLYEGLLETLLLVIKRDIFNNFCCGRMEHLGLKYQIENLQKDLNTIQEQNNTILQILQISKNSN